MDDWTDLDAAYLQIFDEHPDLDEPRGLRLVQAPELGDSGRETHCHRAQVTSRTSKLGQLERGTRTAPEVDCRVMDAQSLEFGEDTFDAVVSAFVVHIVPDPQALITNAVRVLRPGGLVALIVPGRAHEEPDEWQDPVQEVVREYRKFQPDGIGRHTGGDYESEEQLMVDAGLVAVCGRSLEIELAVPDGDTYWRWMNSHGAGTFAKALPKDLSAEMKERILTLVDQSGGVLLRRSAALWIGHHP